MYYNGRSSSGPTNVARTTPLHLPPYTIPVYTPTWTNTHKSTLFSAYYETRPQMHAPSVVVLGYQPRSNWKSPLYCAVTLHNGTSICLPKMTIVSQQCRCNKYIHYTEYEPVYHICVLDKSTLVPVSVRLSPSKGCSSATDFIKVYNFRPERRRKFGVCVQTPVYGNLQNSDIVNFIEMNRVLGANIFTVYSQKALNDLAHQYKDVLDLVKWPSSFKRTNILHYYGEILAIHDCLYRNMHRVEYLFFIDIDEIVVPAGTNMTWTTIVEEMDHRHPKEDTSVLIFNNVYYTYQKGADSKYIQLCKKVSTPKYLTHVRRSLCEYHHPRRSKLLVKPQEVFQLDIHTMCVGIHSKVVVPPTLGSLHHYRNKLSADCKTRAYAVDTGMRAYRDQLIDRLKTTFCP